MDVLVVTVFASLILVAAALIFLFKRVREGDFEHGDRLSLLPLEDDAGPGGALRDPPGPRHDSPGGESAPSTKDASTAPADSRKP